MNYKLKYEEELGRREALEAMLVNLVRESIPVYCTPQVSGLEQDADYWSPNKQATDTLKAYLINLSTLERTREAL